jgi:YD repeat-containing protein
MKKLIVFLLCSFILFNAGKSQTSGPNVPETMSFEPVDATDMVNLSSGNFVYVLPVLNIPGSSAGFPLALSYHGGITMDQEASWVGLGWTLNPGAINRGVNGYPDDFKNDTSITITYDNGETYTQNFVGINAQIYCVTVGVSVSWGSSWSVEGSVGIGIEYVNASVYFGGGSEGGTGGVRAGVGIQNTPLYLYGGAGTEGVYVGLGVGYGYINLGVSYNFTQNQTNIGMSVTDGELRSFTGNNLAFASMQVSFGSNGPSGSASVGPIGTSFYSTATNNSNVQTYSKGWFVPLGGITFGHSGGSWWYLDEQNFSINGALNLSQSYFEKTDDDSWRHQGVQSSRHLSDVVVCPFSEETTMDAKRIETYANLMMPAYDVYSVNAQGLNGTMSPKYFESRLLTGQTRVLNEFHTKDGNEFYDNYENEIWYYHIAGNACTDQDRKVKKFDDTVNPYFYFNGYPTSSLLVHELEFNAPDPNNTNPIWGDFELLPATQSGNEYKSYSDNVDLPSNRKVDANFVLYFTNRELIGDPQLARSKGFIETRSFAPDQVYSNPRENPDLFAIDGIGAFVITSFDGLNYHYSLPVYQFDEYHRHREQGSNDFFLRIQPGKYAYAWLLTAITGPDYVDRGAEGFDDEDYGYWVDLEYGKWTDAYFWKTPYTDDESYKFGRKQIYYLNSIQTRSHIAYFVKSLREDGVGCSEDNTYPGRGGLDSSPEVPGTNLPVIPWPEQHPDVYNFMWDLTVGFNFNETKLLKLDKIILFDKANSDVLINYDSGEDLITQVESSLEYSGMHYYGIQEINYIDYDPFEDYHPHHTTNHPDQNVGAVNYTFTHYNEDNVLDINDIDQAIYTKALKTVNLKYEDDEYALCRETPNSGTTLKTKLTLKKVEILNKEARKIFPDYEFEYYTYDNNMYNINKMDRWGFHISNPDNWSLKTIKTPTGSDITIEYESDSYKTFSLFNDIFQTLDFEKPENVELVGYNQLDIVLKIPESYNMGKIVNGVDDIFVSMDVVKMKFDPDPEFLGDEYFTEHDADLIGTNFGNRTIKVRFNWNGDFEIVDMKNISVKFSYPNSSRGGGGIRVSSLNISDGVNTYTTNYSYNDPATGATSGVTTYAPFFGRAFIPYAPVMPGPGVLYEYVTVSQVQNSETLLETVYNFEVPEIVTEPTAFNFQMGDQFSIENPQLSLPFISPLVPATGGDHSRTVFARSAVMHNKTASIGQLKSITTYNAEGDLLSKTINHYTDTIGLGVNEETYYYLKNHVRWHSTGHGQSTQKFRFVSTSKIDYPSVLSHVETHSGGNVSHTYYDEFDENTSLATVVRQTFSNDAEYKTVSVPAYNIESYKGSSDGTVENAGMGSRVYNIHNKNMLSQNAATISYKNVNDTFKVIGTDIQTWNNNWDDTYLAWNTGIDAFEYNGDDPENTNIWRTHKTFVWNGELKEDGTFKDFEDYDEAGELIAGWTTWFSGDVYDKWIKTSENTRYDHFSNPVEVMDINGDFAASKKDPGSRYVIASAANASLASFTATGFEDLQILDGNIRHFGGEVTDPSTSNPHAERYRCDKAEDDGETEEIPGIYAHTGNYYLKVPAMTNGPKYTVTAENGLQTGRKYRASVWMHKTSYDQSMIMAKVYTSSGSTTEVARAEDAIGTYGDWKLVNLDFNVPANATKMEISVAGSSNDPAYFDDLRVSPYESAVSSYTYDKSGNVTAILNNDNFATKYYYDAASRLVKTEKETESGFEKTAAYQYNFAEGISVTPNIQQDFDFEGVQDFRFDFSKPSGTSLNVSVPWWMETPSVHSGYFTVDAGPNFACNQVNTGNIVVTTNPATEEIVIPVTQAEPPDYYNLYIVDDNYEPLPDNVLHIGSTYRIGFFHCNENIAFDMVIYQYDGNQPYRKVQVIHEDLVTGQPVGAPFVSDWPVPDRPQPEQQGLDWNHNVNYRIHLESTDNQEVYIVSDVIHTGDRIVDYDIEQLRFIEPTSSFNNLPVSEVVSGVNRYVQDLEWYTNDLGYERLRFSLQVWTDYYQSVLVTTLPLPAYFPEDWAYVNVNLGSQAWTFLATHLENLLQQNITNPAHQQSTYYYRITAEEVSDPEPCTTCPAAYTPLFTIDGIDTPW